jgi:hypothetical protein
LRGLKKGHIEMGLFDSVKKMFSSAPAPAVEVEVEEEVSADDDSGEEPFDLAGFDPDDEEAFFNAVLHMESEGLMGGTDESRAKIMAQFGIRDRSHWQDVKASMYQALSQKHGSFEAAYQREMNWRQGQTNNMMAGNVSAKAASGELNPVEGISLESWAAINAAIVGGANFDDLLKGAGIDKVRWDKARSEWEARMSRDTTFAIATVYGNAFTAASQGKYSNLAREANAARLANIDLTSPLPITLDQYFEAMYEQSYAAAQGKNAAEALKQLGLTMVDFVDLSSFMGYHFERNALTKHKEWTDAMNRAEAKVKNKYPGVQADVDIAF